MQVYNQKSHLDFLEHRLGVVPIIAILAQTEELFFMGKGIVEEDMLEKPYWLLLGLNQ